MYLRVCSSQRKEARISTHIANAFKIFTEGSKIIQISRYVKISLTISREKFVYQLFESRTKHIRKLFLSPSVSRALIFTFLRAIGERFFAKRVQNSDTEKIEGKKKSREKSRKFAKKRVVRARVNPLIIVEHLVFAAMSNWPGCSGFAEISPSDQGMVRWEDFPAATI